MLLFNSMALKKKKKPKVFVSSFFLLSFLENYCLDSDSKLVAVTGDLKKKKWDLKLVRHDMFEIALNKCSVLLSTAGLGRKYPHN